ncbi:hypothetical protein C8J57DRAFT_1605485 [Mycena rebaudengoi]|nr:hypothetical protein C8J57DRAFT_1605485 [Mycena rebaudengoi]
MPNNQPSVALGNLIQYTTLAASTVQTIGATARVPFLAATATLTLSILKCVESVRRNKEEYVQMAEQIHEILCAIVKLYSTSENKGVLPTALLYGIVKFTEHRIFTVLNSQQRMGRVRQIFKQPDIAAKLKKFKQELHQAMGMFRVQATGSVLSQAMQIKNDTKQQHEELPAILEAQPDLGSSGRSSVTGTLSSSDQSSVSISMLPPSPKIFHGRESELQDIVEILIQDSARIAILGTGGMGKTSLATVALHHAQLLLTIADHIGVEKGSNLSRNVVVYLAHAPPSLIVLDNLETPWESASSRSDVEEFLSLIADVPHLGLMITLRGAERPGKVKWTRPFLLPLDPISSSAAIQTFIDITDSTHHEDSVKQLLEITGNLPLAVTPIAGVAVDEGCDSALAQWKAESTQMLSDGYDKRSNLDISIMLSFTSSRMTTGAQELLSILSMLPDGLTDSDLVQANLPVANILACKVILIRTSLAYIDKDQRLKALLPIREHIHRAHPPKDELKLKIRQHSHGILDLWNQFRYLNAADIVPQISQSLGNFNSVLLDALNTECPDANQNALSILYLNNFYRRTQMTYSSLFMHLSSKMETHGSDTVLTEYLPQRVQGARHFQSMDAEREIVLGNQHFESKAPLDQAKWHYALGDYFQWSNTNVNAALNHYQKALSLSDSAGQPQTIAQLALSEISQIMINLGDTLGAHKHAKKAQDYAGHLGDIYGMAYSMWLEAQCDIKLANYRQAQILLKSARELLNSCGLQGGTMDMGIRNLEAEIHLVKTEYLESKHIQAIIASTMQPKTYYSIMANLNIALIDIPTGVDAKVIRQNLNTCQDELTSLNGFARTATEVWVKTAFADLYLCEQDTRNANAMFLECMTLFGHTMMEGTLFALERLADPATRMNSIQVTLCWAGIFLGLALKSKDDVYAMRSLQCLGQIFAIEGDDYTALSLFTVALEGYTFMDIHRWRADCMVQIGDIWKRKGEMMKSVEFWNAARPLFERSSQAKDVIRIDVKLAGVDSAILEDYKKKLQRLAELNAPVGEADIEDIDENLGDEHMITGHQAVSNQMAI